MKSILLAFLLLFPAICHADACDDVAKFMEVVGTLRDSNISADSVMRYIIKHSNNESINEPAIRSFIQLAYDHPKMTPQELKSASLKECARLSAFRH